MSKKIKRLTKKVRQQLTWPVHKKRGAEIHTLEICTDHEKRSHTISIPDRDVRDIEYLHELGHALFCETVHPQFSTQYFERGAPEQVIAQIKPACQVASDWFIDHWLIGLAPSEEKSEIEEHFNLVVARLKKDPGGSPEVLCGAALMIAQMKKYCRPPAMELFGVLRPAVDALLAVDPERPTAEKLAAAINGLLTCYSSFRVEPITDDGVECWRITQKEVNSGE